MKVQLLGIGAVKITLDEVNIYIDAFNDYNQPPDIKEHDLILFTHDDVDHFYADSLVKKVGKGNRIIGPPSIAYPLWKTNKVDIEQLIVLYPKEYHQPKTYQDNGVKITIYNTEHFINWHNIHISFLIEYQGKRLYITGDSKIRQENIAELFNLECLIYSMLEEEIVKGRREKRFAKHYHLCEIIKIKEALKPKKMVINHLINYEWAINPAELTEYIKDEKISNVIIPVVPSEVIWI